MPGTFCSPNMWRRIWNNTLVARAFTRSWRMRSEARRARAHGEFLHRRGGQPGSAGEVQTCTAAVSAATKSRTNRKGLLIGCHHRRVGCGRFSFLATRETGNVHSSRSGEKRCGASIRKFKPRSGQRLFRRWIQDEILTRLSKIADLKVISRTSTQHYKSAPENLPEIARLLGVAYVLEEPCRRAPMPCALTCS